jgi:predicted dehydrogenase
MKLRRLCDSGEILRRHNLLMKDVVRIGIIGAGFARTTQIPGFKNCEGAKIIAIASAHREHAEEVAREFDIPNVEDDWRGVVARDDVDLVSIVTPVVTHCEMTLAALDAGKAVLCEKPMAMNADEARRMWERAQEKGVLALIDHELRFLPARIKLRQLLRHGEIGKLRHARLVLRSDSRADVDRPWDWWSDITQGGGALGALGSHAIDAFRWLLRTEISDVLCQLATHVNKRKDKSGTMRDVTTDDETNMLLRFADNDLTEGATGNVSLSVVEAGKPEHRLEIFGARGAYLIEDNQLCHANVGDGDWKKLQTDAGELAEGTSDNDWSRGFTAFACKIVDALREGRTTVDGAATFEDGYRTQLVLDAARRSNERGCWEKLAAD